MLFLKCFVYIWIVRVYKKFFSTSFCFLSLLYNHVISPHSLCLNHFVTIDGPSFYILSSFLYILSLLRQSVLSLINVISSLLNRVLRVPQVPNCPRAWVPEYPNVLQVPKSLSAQVPKVPVVPECLSSLRVLKCKMVLRVPFDFPLSPNFSLSSLPLKNVWNITRNGLANSFIEFLKILHNTYF